MIFMLGNDYDYSQLSPTVQGVIVSAGLQGDNILTGLRGYWEKSSGSAAIRNTDILALHGK